MYPIDQALTKKDAVHMGYWGDHLGDILVVTDGHFYSGRGESPSAVVPSRGLVTASHAFQPLTFETTLASHMAMVIAAGPDIKAGYERPANKLNRLHLRDLTPTWCKILGVAPPAQSEGSVAYDLFEGHEGPREHKALETPPLWTDDDAIAFNLARGHMSRRRSGWQED